MQAWLEDIHRAWLSVVHFPNKEYLILRSAEVATGSILLRISINEMDGEHTC